MKADNAFNGKIKVRYRDTDAQGHLYFANYLVFADEMVGEYMEELGYDTSDLSTAPVLIFTVNINCDYLGECLCGDTVRTLLQYERLGTSSAVVGFRLFNEASEEPLARGQITQVFVERETRKSCPIPGSLRQAILARHSELA